MSWEAAGFIKKQLECPDGSPLSRGQKLILFVLSDYHDMRKKMAWPSVATIAEESLTSLRQTQRDLAYLEEHLAIVRVRRSDGRGATYAYRFVGFDLDVAAAIDKRKKGGHDVTPFSAEKRVSEGCQKDVKTDTKRVSEGCQGGHSYKEEPKPTTNLEPEQALRAPLSYADRARKFAENLPVVVGKFSQMIEDRKPGLTGVHDWDLRIKRLILQCADESRIPAAIALALTGYDETQCTEFGEQER